ncbi:TetR/AcrR family transcriptional regulator [Xaviernesmea oryzae]|uniref:DNA-binding transcriptional regulator, AcrR family n=1 Tax=Xaviernesmea oryzae TaxID=464029 RepID=A0A1X7FUD7_9HYPH|nr:TetR/AcrR family transcriptional regulator [Xaviernesmea oryzae]SMF58373.1 DNA-binding transcriptional regulator, AcrR family [Xaviernesmea oryzae]
MTNNISSLNPKLSQAPHYVRTELLDHALELVLNTRLNQDIVERLASAVQVKPAFIFRHFRTSIDLADALGQRYLGQLKLELQALPSTGSAIGDLRILFLEICDRYWQSRRQASGILDVVIIAIERDGLAVRSYHHFLENTVDRIIKQGQKTGEIRINLSGRDTLVTFNSLMAVADPYSFWRYGHAMQREMIRQQIDVVLRPLTKEPETANSHRLAS